MAEIFRKAALDRLSSPEQLDKQIIITSPLKWLAAAGIALALVVVIIWGCFGRLPEKTEISGILLKDGDFQGVYAVSSGTAQVFASKGDTVKKDDVIASINSAEIDDQISKLEKIISSIKKITLSSENDTYISEASSLLEIKQEYYSNTAKEQNDLQLEELEKQLSDKKAYVKKLKKEYKAAETNYLDKVGDDSFNIYNYNYQAAVSEFDAASSTYSQTMTSVNNAAQQYSNALQTYGETDEITIAAKTQYDSAVASSTTAKSNYESAQTNLTKARKKYETAYKSQNSNNSDLQALQDKMTEKSSLYSSALSEMFSLQSSINNLQIQISTQQLSDESQNSLTTERFVATKQATLKQYNDELATQKGYLNDLQIKATADGVLTEIVLEDHQAVTAGSCVARIKTMASTERHVICFVPLSQARKIKKDMVVTMTPSEVNEQEYGHMTGKVVDVDKNSTSVYEMTKTLGDDLLVTQLQQQGSSVKIELEINRDDSSESGYEWSNKKGSKLSVSDNSLVIVNVITDSYAPITKLIPKLKEMLSSTGEKDG